MGDTTARAAIQAAIDHRRHYGLNSEDSDYVLERLEAAGFRVVPTDLVDNARDVCGPASDEDWTIVRKTSFDALASSFAALDGDDPLNVFAGKP